MRLMTSVPVILALFAAVAPAKEPPQLREQANAIRPTDDEVKFKKIPWLTDIFEGFEVAKSEKRPVLLYLVLGDALDDC